MKVTSKIAASSVARFQLLSRLLAGSKDSGERIEALLADVADTFQLEEAGLRWPVSGQWQVHCVAGKPDREPVAKWDSEVSNRLTAARSSDETIIDPQNDRRLLIPVFIEGRRNGVFWAVSSDGFQEEARQGLIVAAQCLSRHPAFVDRIGASCTQDRTVQRIQDAAQAAGKIAHDFDNIFTGVVGFAEMVLSLLEPGSTPHQYVSEINSAGIRGTQFTQQLHQLSRSGLCRPLPTTVSSILSREEIRLRKSAKGVRLQFVSANDLPPVAVDAGSLQIALAHLLDNAIEASPATGLVRVTSALIELSDVEAREFLGAAAAGPFVEICVGDEGPGIRDEHRSKLFAEPFFTTKVRHRGLGLPVVYRILHAHRGGIRFESAPGRGSVFQMVLPLSAARFPETAAANPEVKRIPGGRAS